MQLIENHKIIIEHKEFNSDVKYEDLSKHRLNHVFAVRITFIDVSFKQSDFLHCYFRNCRFIRCDFTGASLSKSNLKGSQYEQCKFHYSTWEHTHIDDEFLDNCLPSEVNLARDLVRSLRVNFGHIGNYDAVNKAASIEVTLTGKHLFYAAYSKQSYYRSKFKRWKRFFYVLKYLQWKFLDLLWGNGESLLKVLFCAVMILIFNAMTIDWLTPEVNFFESFGLVFYSFWGVPTKLSLSKETIVMLTILRFIFLGLFMAILIKRLARR